MQVEHCEIHLVTVQNFHQQHCLLRNVSPRTFLMFWLHYIKFKREIKFSLSQDVWFCCRCGRQERQKSNRFTLAKHCTCITLFWTFLRGVLKTKTPKTPQDPPPNDSELNWLGLGNWVNQVSGQFVQYNDLHGTWFTQFPNPNQYTSESFGGGS